MHLSLKTAARRTTHFHSGALGGSEHSSSPFDFPLRRPPIHQLIGTEMSSGGFISSNIPKKESSARGAGCGTTAAAGSQASNEGNSQEISQRNDDMDTFIMLLWMAGYVANLAFLYQYIGILKRCRNEGWI